MCVSLSRPIEHVIVKKKEVEKEKKNCGSYSVSACCWIFVWFTAPEWSTRNSPIAPNFSEWCAAAGIIVLYVSLERCIAGMSEDVFEKQGVAYSKGEYYVPTRHLSLHILFSFFIVNLDPRITRYMHLPIPILHAPSCSSWPCAEVKYKVFLSLLPFFLIWHFFFFLCLNSYHLWQLDSTASLTVDKCWGSWIDRLAVAVAVQLASVPSG